MTHPEIWQRKRPVLVDDLRRLADDSPILELITIEHRPDELRVVLALEIPTLVTPIDDGIRLAGPVVVGLRYASRFCTVPPLPWEIVTILHPTDPHHPNIGGTTSNVLCLGEAPAGISLVDIVHLTYGALTLNSYNPTEWEGLNASASAYVRQHAGSFPILETGLLETPPAELHRPFPPVAEAIAAELRELGVAGKGGTR